MNLKFINPDYQKNKTTDNLNYSFFKEYSKKYNNKIIFIGGFGNAGNIIDYKIFSIKKPTLIDQVQHKFEIDMIVKRYQNTFLKRLNKSPSKSSASSTYHSLFFNKSTKAPNNKSRNSNHNLYSTQISNRNSNGKTMEKSASVSTIHTKKNKNQLIIKTIPVFNNKKTNIWQSMLVENMPRVKMPNINCNNTMLMRNKRNADMDCNSKGYNYYKQEKTTTLEHYNKGLFAEVNKKIYKRDKNYIIDQLRKEYNFFKSKKEDNAFEKKKLGLFIINTSLSSKLLPKHSIQRIEEMFRKERSKVASNK